MNGLLFMLLFVENVLLGGIQHKFVFVVASYNCAKWCANNLESVLFQNYTSSLFRVIYTDDNSTDGTAKYVEEFVKNNNKQSRFRLIKNSVRNHALFNYNNMVQLCDDDEIVVMVDGDDWLKHKDVLSYLNTIYQSDDVWLTYGRYELANSSIVFGRPFPRDVIEKGDFANFFKQNNNDFRASPLRSFRAWLFKMVDNQLFLNENGCFFSTASDVAYMFGMLKIATNHIYFINEPLYIYNTIRKDNDYKINSCLKRKEIEQILVNYSRLYSKN